MIKHAKYSKSNSEKKKKNIKKDQNPTVIASQ